MGNMKFKVGDRVRIKSLDWYNKNIKNNGIIICGSESFTHPMSHFCDKVVTIVTIQDDCYRILEDDGDWYWTDEMIEGLVEEETKPNTIEEAKTYWDSIKDAWICPEGYIFKDENGNVINATKIVLEKKKREYPKTYEECCGILDVCSGETLQYGDLTLSNDYEFNLYMRLENFRKLLICRDAYWKIAGEEMGLGKPWEPIDNSEVCYGIFTWAGEIQHDTTAKWCILTFPTEEMRDAFYENFKEEIEICKELL